jgi:hypothetical protein
MAVRHQSRAIRSRGAGANLRKSLLFVISPYGNVFNDCHILLYFLSDGIAYIPFWSSPQLMAIGS